jgi:hypothetical protein
VALRPRLQPASLGPSSSTFPPGGLRTIPCFECEAHHINEANIGLDNTMVKALARAFRWREMLENKHANITEIAAVEKVNESYVRRVLRLTLLAPDIVEAILEGRQSAEITLAVLMRPFAVTWMEQRKTLIGCLPRSPACLDAMP